MKPRLRPAVGAFRYASARLIAVGLWTGAVLHGCSGPAERENIATRASEVIYGVDDRKNPPDFAPASFAHLWADAVAVLGKRPGSTDSLCRSSFGNVCYLNKTLATTGPMAGAKLGLCPDERFANETVLLGSNLCTAFRVPRMLPARMFSLRRDTA
jgi:hypothetical protein